MTKLSTLSYLWKRSSRKWQQISRRWYTLTQLATVNWFILMASGVSNTKNTKHIYFQCFQELPANIYLFKINNRNTRKRCEICSKLTIKSPERRHWLTLNIFHTFFCVSVVNFEQVNVSWHRNVILRKNMFNRNMFNMYVQNMYATLINQIHVNFLYSVIPL